MIPISQAEVEQELDTLFTRPCLPDTAVIPSEAEVIPMSQNKRKADHSSALTLDGFDNLRITKEKKILHPEPTITMGGAAVASPENITAISAAAKAGKTAIKGALVAGAISPDGNVDGLGLTVRPNPDGLTVIDMDTEQSEADHQDNHITSLRRAGLNSTPDYLRAYNIRKLNLNDYQTITDDICRLCSERFGGIHSIFIDGGADYIASVNDEESASKIVQYFIGLAIRYKCPVIVIVHQNPGSDKERGHFGSEIQRKCFGLLSIKRDGDISTLEPKIMRKAGNADIAPVNFKYCKEKGYHILSESGDRVETKARKDRERVEEIAKAVFSAVEAYSYPRAVSMIMDHTSRGETTAKGMLKNMAGWGYLSIGSDKLYRRVSEVSEVSEGQNRSTDL